MPTFLGWNEVTIPPLPPAPSSFDLVIVTAAAVNISPFTGQQQVQVWSSGSGPNSWKEMSVSWPGMINSVAQPWVTFLANLQGPANVFQFTSAFQTTYPEVSGLFWRIKGNSVKWGVTRDRLYTLQFEIRQAI